MIVVVVLFPNQSWDGILVFAFAFAFKVYGPNIYKHRYKAKKSKSSTCNFRKKKKYKDTSNILDDGLIKKTSSKDGYDNTYLTFSHSINHKFLIH